MKKKLLGLLFAVCMLVTGAAVFEAKAEEIEYQESIEDAAQIVRWGIEDRETTISVGLMCEEEIPEPEQRLLEEAVVHDCVPFRGDYLRWSLSQVSSELSSYSDGTNWYYTVVYTMEYLTTAEQEEELDDAVDALLDELNLWQEDEYDKICGIYDYICSNVVYDYENAGNDRLKYTAYSALINKTAVSQGYAALFYRLALELAVDVRMISGCMGDSEPHVWNIVRVRDVYYNLDASLDAGQEEPSYFLIGSELFSRHHRDERYNTDKFHADYPTSKDNFDERTIRVEINAENFPDEAFRRLILQSYDYKKDGVLQDELKLVYNMGFPTYDISDLTGIAYFSNLTYLNCNSNSLTSLDVSGCSGLQTLECASNSLTDLNVSGCTELEKIYCYGNNLTHLDVSTCTKLETLWADNNVYYICENATFSLSNLNGFDATKASNWTGAVYDAATNTLHDISETVTYLYDCGGGFSANFTLKAMPHVDEDDDRACDRCGCETEEPEKPEEPEQPKEPEESDAIDAFVDRMYTTILEREPDAGSQTWVNVLKNGSYTGAQVAEGFIMSEEFLNKELTNEEFVQIMYRAFFGREADTSGLETWKGYLDQGYIKKFVFVGFANSDEFQALCDNYGITRGHIKLTMAEQTPNLSAQEFDIWQFVERLYSEVLGRTPDREGMNTWSGVLRSGEYTGAQVAEGFIMSEEFLNKNMTDTAFVQIMYKAFFGRNADSEGLATWKNALKTGYTKRFVFAGFANSNEFGVLCELYGITQGSVAENDTVPDRPYKIENEINGVSIYWNALRGVEQYGVWRSETGVNGSYRWLGNSAGTEFTDTAVESGTTYHYRLTSYDAGTQTHSEMSEAIHIIYVDTPEITGIYNETNGITLEWSAVEGATGYEIYREITGGSEPYWHKIESLEGNDILSLTSRGTFEYGKSYRFTVCALAGEDRETRSAYNTEGWGTVRLRTPVAISYPNYRNKTIHLEWDENDTIRDVDGYEVRLLQDSVEYKIYSQSGGGSGSQGKFFARKEFREADGLEGLEGKLTLQVRSYKSMDGLGKCYSGWSEAVELVTFTEFEARLNRLVEELTASAETDLEKAIEIYKWVVFHTEYVHYGYAIGQEVIYAEAVILHGKAICDGYAKTFQLLAEKAGLEVNYVAGDPVEGDGHAWNQVKIDGKWYNLDATWGDVYVANQEILEDYIKIYWQFLLSDEEFDETHGKYCIDRTESYECPENYDIFGYVIEHDGEGNGVYASNLEELRSKIEQKLQEEVSLINVWYVNRDTKLNESEYRKMMKAIAENATDVICFSEVKMIDEIENWIYKGELAAVSYENIEGKNTLVIPDGMTSIGGNALAHMEDLEKVVLPDSITSIGSQAFLGCTNLKEIHIPDSVTLIMDYAFKECSSLVRIDIPKGVSRIMNWTFAGCSSLEEVKLHDGVMQIDFAAFMDCSSLKSIHIPEGVIHLDECVFLGCSSLTEIHIPESVTEIDSGAFLGCNEKLTLYCPAGSYAETFAIENGLAYVTQ